MGKIHESFQFLFLKEKLLLILVFLIFKTFLKSLLNNVNYW